MANSENRWQDIFKHLKEHNFDVRSPGISKGDCTNKYVVVKFGGETSHGSFSTNDTYYDLLCYVPKERYSQIDSFVREVQKCMKDMEPMIIPTNEVSPSYYDDNFKAHYVSIGYKNYKRRL